jgi:hypothetical protein
VHSSPSSIDVAQDFEFRTYADSCKEFYSDSIHPPGRPSVLQCAWLHRMIDHIYTSCGISVIQSSMIIYEDNVACVAQMETRNIKTNYMKNMSLILSTPTSG